MKLHSGKRKSFFFLSSKWIYSCNVSSDVRCDMTQNYFKFKKIAHWTQKHVLFLRFSFHKITRYSHSRLSSVYIQNILYRYTFPRWHFLNFFFVMVSFLILKFSYGYHSQQGMFPTSPKKKEKENTKHTSSTNTLWVHTIHRRSEIARRYA